MNVCTIYIVLVNTFDLLVSCTKITYDDYNTIIINEAFITNFLKLFYNYYIGTLCNYPTSNYNNSRIIINY